MHVWLSVSLTAGLIVGVVRGRQGGMHAVRYSMCSRQRGLSLYIKLSIL